MGASKKKGYKEMSLQMAAIAKAIAHPARITITTRLVHGPCTGQELRALLPISQATFCQHIEQLTRGGLVSSRYTNEDFVYEVEPMVLGRLQGFLGALHYSEP